MGAPTDPRTKNQTSFSWTRRDEWMDNFLEFPFIIKTSYLQLSFLYTLFVLGMRREMKKIGMEMGGKNESNSFDVSYDDCYDDLIFFHGQFCVIIVVGLVLGAATTLSSNSIVYY